jgi:hemoglobin-like flavoprotein
VRVARQGVGARQYDAIAEALVAALAGGLGSRFTPAHREAWAVAYDAVARIMTAALEDEPLAA